MKKHLKIKEIKKAVSEGGLTTLLRRIYKFILMQTLPAKIVHYNGIKVREGKRLGFLIPGENYSNKPSYEKGIINSLEANLTPGDEVVVIGGGRGVTAITAKKIVGNRGKVTVYEPAEEMAEKIKYNAKINNIELDKIIHSSVGEINNPWGGAEESDKTNPRNIPKCNLLEVDCEGGEKEILDKLEIEPETLVIESHGVFGCSSEEVKERVLDRGYEITNEEYAEDNPNCKENDIKVITANDN